MPPRPGVNSENSPPELPQNQTPLPSALAPQGGKMALGSWARSPAGPRAAHLAGDQRGPWPRLGSSRCCVRGTLCWLRPEVQPSGASTFHWTPQVREARPAMTMAELPEIRQTQGGVPRGPLTVTATASGYQHNAAPARFSPPRPGGSPCLGPPTGSTGGCRGAQTVQGDGNRAQASQVVFSPAGLREGPARADHHGRPRAGWGPPAARGRWSPRARRPAG